MLVMRKGNLRICGLDMKQGLSTLAVLGKALGATRSQAGADEASLNTAASQEQNGGA